MSPVAETFETRAAELISWVLPHDEENNPMPDDPTPGMLVAWVTERLGQAGFELEEYRDWQQSGEGHASLYQVGVHFLGAAAHAISAIAHVYPAGEDVAPIEFKDLMLHELDEVIQANLETEFYASASGEEWLALTLALLVGACQGTCALEGLPRLAGRAGESEEDEAQSFGGDFGGDYEEDEDEDFEEGVAEEEGELRAEIADSLRDAAVMAGTAGQWFIERQEREAEKERRRKAARKRRTAANRAS